MNLLARGLVLSGAVLVIMCSIVRNDWCAGVVIVICALDVWRIVLRMVEPFD